MEDAPLAWEDSDLIRRVRDVLERADYTESRILELLGAKELPPVRAREQLLPLWLRRTASGTPLALLVDLFVLHLAADLDSFRRAIRPTGLEEWTALGLVQVDGALVRAAVELLAHGDLRLATDWPGQPPTTRKHVMGISGSSRTLADFTIRRPSSQTLDLGTGCGVQALLAAGHSDVVWAVDRNPRALNLTAFNARLNGRDNIRCAEGDLFEPVAGQRFDLVVANLPFVIAPEARYLYCQSGLPADGICRTVVQAVPTYLREGACCQIVSDIAHVRGEDWRQRLAGWFEGNGCDAWVLYSLTLDAATYAAHWLRETEGPDLRPLGPRFDAWMTYYEQERIEAVSFALIALRRASGRKNWFRCDEAAGSRTPSGAAVALGFALRDYLETVRADDQLLEARLRRAPALQWEQKLEPSADGWEVNECQLRTPTDWGPATKADATVLFIVARCQGERSVRDILTELAAAAGHELAAIIPGCLELIRRLVEQGILFPA